MILALSNSSLPDIYPPGIPLSKVNKWRQNSNVCNLFKVNNKDTRTTSTTLLTLNLMPVDCNWPLLHKRRFFSSSHLPLTLPKVKTDY